jgi:putative oxidoreductase
VSPLSRSFLLHPHWGLILRLVLGAVFAFASTDKILNPSLFARSVMDYRLLPLSLVIPLAVLLPWTELIAGVLLIVGWLRRGSAAVILILLAVFMVAIASALARGIDIACGCFSTSPEGERLAWETLGRDALLILAALQVLLSPRTSFEVGRRRTS